MLLRPRVTSQCARSHACSHVSECEAYSEVQVGTFKFVPTPEEMEEGAKKMKDELMK